MLSLFANKKLESAQKLFESSKEFEDSGNLEKALDCVEKAQALQPENPILKVRHFKLENKIKGDTNPFESFKDNKL